MLALPAGGRPRRPTPVRPALEVLEGRCLPAVPAPVVPAPIPVPADVSGNTAVVAGVLTLPGPASAAGPAQTLPAPALPYLIPGPALGQSPPAATTLTSAPAAVPITLSPSFVLFYLSSGGGVEDLSVGAPQGGNPGAGSEPGGVTPGGAASRQDGDSPGAESQPDGAVWLDFLFAELP